jgi:hypothetical protein
MPTSSPDLITDAFINPFGLGLTLAMCLLMLVLPRKYALFPVFVLVCYMTIGMKFIVAGLNFTMLRILILFASARVILRGELKGLHLNKIDKMLVLFVLSSIIIYTILLGSYDGFKYQLGIAYNTIGFYFLFRFLLKHEEDIVRAIKMLSLLAAPLAFLMLAEKASGHNIFHIFGGVPAMSAVRDGVLRCQGPFRHPIMAGTFGAGLMPLFAGLWYLGHKRYAALGFVSGTVILITAASSGPLLAAIAGLGGLMAWRIRTHMKLVRRTFVLGVCGLALVMKAPVWYIVAKVDIFSGSTGWHRAFIIDMAVKHFSEWWLMGVKSTRGWASYDQIWDLTNQYVVYAVNGGLLPLCLFVTVIVLCFKAVGKMVQSPGDEAMQQRWLVWSLGATMWCHVVNFFSISYLDQNFIVWYMVLAMISALAGSYLLLQRPFAVAAEQEPAAISAPQGFAEGEENWGIPGVAPL